MNTRVLQTRATADALAWAIDRLDSEEHRYVERYGDCPNGCAYTYVDDPDAPMTLTSVGGQRAVRAAGPTDCTLCDPFAGYEDEDAPWINPDLDALRNLLIDIDPLRAHAMTLPTADLRRIATDPELGPPMPDIHNATKPGLVRWLILNRRHHLTDRTRL